MGREGEENIKTNGPFSYRKQLCLREMNPCVHYKWAPLVRQVQDGTFALTKPSSRALFAEEPSVEKSTPQQQ